MTFQSTMLKIKHLFIYYSFSCFPRAVQHLHSYINTHLEQKTQIQSLQGSEEASIAESKTRSDTIITYSKGNIKIIISMYVYARVKCYFNVDVTVQVFLYR